MSTFKISRTKQCSKCPWKIKTNPHEIPDGYCETKHGDLIETIADPGSLIPTGKAMACHHSTGSDQMYCIGWLNQQLGIGNNIPLRLKMLNCENVKDIKVYGKQHERFEDTLPKKEQS